MGYAADDTSKFHNKRVEGNLRNVGNPQGQADAYEYGTVTGVSRTGRYKVFANPFVGKPIVSIGVQRFTGGTVVPRLQGTPALGSFNASIMNTTAGGSATLYYIAFGQR